MTQQILAITIVALAAGWLALRWWRSLRSKQGSCGCDGCPRAKQKLP